MTSHRPRKKTRKYRWAGLFNAVSRAIRLVVHVEVVVKVIKAYSLNRKIYPYLIRLVRSPLTRELCRKLYWKILDSPQLITLHINRECDLNCIDCRCSNNKPVIDMDGWIDIVEQARSLGVTSIRILGGEPFLHPRFRELLQHCLDRKMFLLLFTNGLHLNEEWIEWLSARKGTGTIITYVKIDHPDVYDHMTQTNGRLEEVIRNIRNARKAGLIVRPYSFPTALNCSGTRMKELISLFGEVGEDPILFRWVPTGNESVDKELDVNSRSLRIALQRLQRLYDRMGWENIDRDFFPWLNAGRCSEFHKHLVILQDGEALPCDFLAPSENIGNARHDRLVHIWDRYRHALKTWNQVPSECKGCKYVETCGGGCKAYCYAVNRGYDRMDPLCDGYPPNKF